MRPIYWGLVLTFAGICSSIILELVAQQIFIKPAMDGIFGMEGYIVSIPPFYIALMYVARFAMFFSLPFATAIEARRSLKGRKSEAKENEEIA